MDISKCEKCIGYKDFNNPINTPCEECIRLDNVSHRENTRFIELSSCEPCNCGECILRIDTDTSRYCSGARFFNKDDRYIAYPYIRKNYMKKGKPKFCPYRNREVKS